MQDVEERHIRRDGQCHRTLGPGEEVDDGFHSLEDIRDDADPFGLDLPTITLPAPVGGRSRQRLLVEPWVAELLVLDARPYPLEYRRRRGIVHLRHQSGNTSGPNRFHLIVLRLRSRFSVNRSKALSCISVTLCCQRYAAAVDSSDIAFAGAATQARMLADGELTAPELLEIYLERIARLDSELRAYRVVLTDKARDEASAAQDRLDAGERLPLLGVPVAVKDDVDVAGEVTTYGGSAHGPAATADAEAVRRLRAAGAVIIGKTSVPELMIMPFTESLALGATRNPWNPSRTPAAAAAAVPPR